MISSNPVLTVPIIFKNSTFKKILKPFKENQIKINVCTLPFYFMSCHTPLILISCNFSNLPLNSIPPLYLYLLGCNVWQQFLRIKGARHFFGVVLCADHEYHNEKILKNNGMCLIYLCSLTLKFPCLFIENGWNARKAVKKYFFHILIAIFSFCTPKN